GAGRRRADPARPQRRAHHPAARAQGAGAPARWRAGRPGVRPAPDGAARQGPEGQVMSLWRILLTLLLAVAAPLAFGADDPLSIKAITLSTNAEGQQEYSVSLQILLIMTALSFIPAFVMLMTSFTRIIIVFSILRQALGLQQTPSNQILIGLALFLTMFIMAPVFDRINQDALQPYLNEQLPAQQAIARAEGPIKEFMLARSEEHTSELQSRENLVCRLLLEKKNKKLEN